MCVCVDIATRVLLSGFVIWSCKACNKRQTGDSAHETFHLWDSGCRLSASDVCCGAYWTGQNLRDRHVTAARLLIGLNSTTATVCPIGHERDAAVRRAG